MKQHNTIVENILEGIFSVSLGVRLASNFLPTAVENILHPASLLTAGAAAVGLLALWICSAVKAKKACAA